jgi:hypothetical protein
MLYILLTIATILTTISADPIQVPGCNVCDPPISVNAPDGTVLTYTPCDFEIKYSVAPTQPVTDVALIHPDVGKIVLRCPSRIMLTDAGKQIDFVHVEEFKCQDKMSFDLYLPVIHKRDTNYTLYQSVNNYAYSITL